MSLNPDLSCDNLKAGQSICISGDVSTTVSSSFTASTLTKTGSSSTIQVYYHPSSTWTTTNAYYSIDSGKTWTTSPGIPMGVPSSSSSYDNTWKYLSIPSSSGQVSVVFNDGKNNWDNHGGQNYLLNQAGIWEVNNNVAKVIFLFLSFF